MTRRDPATFVNTISEREAQQMEMMLGQVRRIKELEAELRDIGSDLMVQGDLYVVSMPEFETAGHNECDEYDPLCHHMIVNRGRWWKQTNAAVLGRIRAVIGENTDS